jgi:hypothetical protein
VGKRRERTGRRRGRGEDRRDSRKEVRDRWDKGLSKVAMLNVDSARCTMYRAVMMLHRSTKDVAAAHQCKADYLGTTEPCLFLPPVPVYQCSEGHPEGQQTRYRLKRARTGLPYAFGVLGDGGLQVSVGDALDIVLL